METPIYKGRPPVVHDIDDYRRGLRNGPNESTVETTKLHKVDLWTLLPAQSMPGHVHSASECVVIVLDGRGSLAIGNRPYDIQKNSLTIVPPGADHSFRNTGPDPLVLLTVQGPGPFETKVKGNEGKENLQ